MNDKRNLSESEVLHQMRFYFEHIELCDDPYNINQALKVIPSEELNLKATLRFSVIDQEDKNENLTLSECLVIELMDWFKTSFFSWTDTPNCAKCKTMPAKLGLVSPTKEEQRWLASRVENYFCNNCCEYIRFPRYKHPGKLLETRTGRCGEWADCFNLLCHALKFEVRKVVDWTDHVWAEIWSTEKRRWIHCDPCENTYDRPLLYEVGWGKKLSYVMAFTKDDIQDVTWRYTSNFKAVLSRRNMCSEDTLIAAILQFRENRQKRLPQEKKEEMKLRMIMELVEFLTPAKLNSESLEGRTSGSLAWRLARGETESVQEITSYVFKPSSNDIKGKYFEVKYCCASDKYFQNSTVSFEVQGWNACAFSQKNIYRKVERDWKRVYLCRSEGSTEASMSWRFDFSNVRNPIRKLNLNLFGKTFESGKIQWSIASDLNNPDDKVTMNKADIAIETELMRGCQCFTISAELSGGSWQHAQLFRQPLDSAECPFHVKVFFL